MTIGDVTISAALAWIIGAFGALAVIYKGIEIIKAIFGKSKSKVEEKLKKHDELLDNDNRRLKEIETALKNQQSGQAVICQGMLSLVNHQLSGNDVDKLREARDKLLTFLTER